MGELVFVGLGLHDEAGISLKGLEEVKSADSVFLELYTSLMPGFSARRFEEISGKKLRIVSRRELEDENGEVVLKVAKQGKAVLLVPGDPLVATTHIAVRLEAEKRGIKTRVVHGASIISAAVGLAGLHNYRFGKSVTIPFPENFSETPYKVIAENLKLGLHTMCLMDINVEERRYLTIGEALEMLLKIEEKIKGKAVTVETLAVGIARAGSRNPTVKADMVKVLLKYDFGDPPYTLIFPGKLHFMEAEALIAFAGAPSKVRMMVQ
ncbi:MAG: diphthine synthase [Nitrososphaerota archaeon]|nr:diphthine synthase [Candidatus Bathyarchaeota archaeon]MDW8022540.1 diphthine synthase [Nitrososphaerota archaeon]